MVIVDWLGRGGIAQTAEAWALEAVALGVPVCVVSRADREIRPDGFDLVGVPSGRSRVLTHRRVVRAAIESIEARRPDVIVVQNYVIPELERAVHRTARDAGSRVVFVVHNQRLHSRLAGSQVGLRNLVGRADEVVAHSRYVGDAIEHQSGRSVSVIPHPIPMGLLSRSGWQLDGAPVARARVALQFGIVKRRYKGTRVVEALAAEGLDDWEFVVAGAGAPRAAVGVRSIPGFLSPRTLVREITTSRATLLPYRRASQSGTIPLAHSLRSVPIAHRVGGLAEQIADGRTGMLVEPGGGLAAWRSALERLEDEDEYLRLAAGGRAEVERQHARFREAVRDRVA